MLSALGWLYGKIIDTRNSHYEKGTLKSFSLGAPTISVGNITVGGTGKTPLVSVIAKLLAERGEKVCIISRGYKRENEKELVVVSDGKKILTDVKKAGDEPFELARKLLGKTIVISDSNRIRAGRFAKENFDTTAFILDDAFQHLRVKRDLDIVVIDATNPFGNKKTLPSGTLREPLSNLRRADLIVMTRTNLVEDVGNITNEIRQHNEECEIITAKSQISNISEIFDFHSGNRSDLVKPGGSAISFCALGNPGNFFQQLKNEGILPAATKAFPDHHDYRQKDIDLLSSLASDYSADHFLTTPKDAVKLAEFKFEFPCYVVESKLIFENEKRLRSQIYTVLNH
ncbi:MAG: tetraacyldisaccharide 4'-kinase [Pyrinomonadaceae bacterium]